MFLSEFESEIHLVQPHTARNCTLFAENATSLSTELQVPGLFLNPAVTPITYVLSLGLVRIVAEASNIIWCMNHAVHFFSRHKITLL